MATVTMTIHEQAHRDINGYIRKTLWSAGVLFLLVMIALFCVFWFKKTEAIKPLLGGLLGSFLATVNLFAIGYAFYAIVIKKGKRWVVLMPLLSFLGMCAIAFILAVYVPDYILGFAIGLTAPVFLGAGVIFSSRRPA